VPSASAGGKKKSKKRAEKYGALESARPEHGRRVSSTRYTTEPRKDEPKSVYLPMTSSNRQSRQSAAEAGKAEEDVDELQMPVVAENDYLLPQSSATAASYLDFAPDSVRGISLFRCCVILYYCC